MLTVQHFPWNILDFLNHTVNVNVIPLTKFVAIVPHDVLNRALTDFLSAMIEIGIMSYGFDLFTVQFSRSSKIQKKKKS